MMDLVIMLVFSHYLCDFALQSSTMAKMKSKVDDIGQKEFNNGMWRGQKYQLTWYYWLTAHAIIHGGVVYLLTGYVVLFWITMLTHFMIDYLKTNKLTNIHQDQGMHHAVILLEVLIVLWS